jgi:hypothetical protein
MPSFSQYFPNLPITKAQLQIASGSVAICLIAVLLFAPKNTSKNTNNWVSASTSLTPPQMNKLIDKNISLSDRVTREYVSKNILMTTVNGLNIYQFNFAEACGYGGCLYSIDDGYASSKAFQLYDKPLFSPGSQPRHLTVVQRSKSYDLTL